MIELLSSQLELLRGYSCHGWADAGGPEVVMWWVTSCRMGWSGGGGRICAGNSSKRTKKSSLVAERGSVGLGEVLWVEMPWILSWVRLLTKRLRATPTNMLKKPKKLKPRMG